MSSMECRCGERLTDNSPESTTVFFVFTEKDFQDREAEPDWRKRIPFTYDAWECTVCRRWYLFAFVSETSEPDLVLIPERTGRTTTRRSTIPSSGASTARMSCRCGAGLCDCDPSSTGFLRVFTVPEIEQRDDEPDARQRLPYRYFVWECKVCGRWYLFTMGSGEPERVLIPDEPPR